MTLKPTLLDRYVPSELDMLIRSLTVFLWLLAAIGGIASQNATANLQFLHLVAGSTDGDAAEAETALAVSEALDSLGSSSLLDGYVLKNTTILISECNVQETTDVLEAQLVPGVEPVSLAVIAGGCSSVAEAVARVSREKGVLHISYSPSFPETPVTERAAVGVHPSRESFFKGVASVLEFYGWRRVAVFSETPANDQPETLLPAGTSLFYSDDTALQKVVDEGIRVLILDTFPQRARDILCQAARGDAPLGYSYPGYVWITPAWYGDRWWDGNRDPEPDSTIPQCTSEDIESVLGRSLAVGAEPPSLGQEVVPIGSTSQSEFRQLYPDPLAGYAYDALWVLALTLEEVATSTAVSSLEDLAYSAEGVAQLEEQLRNVSFNGVTGVVTFSETGTRRVGRTVVLQYRQEDGELVREMVAVASPQFQYSPGENDSSVWPDISGVPPEVKVINTIVVPLTVVYVVLATVGIVYSIICTVFNFACRNRTVVQLSSPNLNYLICAGATILFFSVFFVVWPTTDPDTFEFLCGAIVWSGAIGTSLQYGTIQGKLFRVYLIFRKPHKAVKKVLQDWHLLLYVLALVTIDVILLTIVTSLRDVRTSARLVDDEENPPNTDDNGVTTVSLIHDCRSRRDGADLYWLLLLFGYKFVLQIIATVLAILLCVIKVEVKAMDDSRQIQAITYFNMGILVVSGGLALGVSNYENAKAAVNGLSLLFSASFNLSMVFIPKMVHLYKDPKGQQVFKRRGTTIQEVEATYIEHRKASGTRVKVSPDATTTGSSTHTATTQSSNLSSEHSKGSKQDSSADNVIVKQSSERQNANEPADVVTNHSQDFRHASSADNGMVNRCSEKESKDEPTDVDAVAAADEDRAKLQPEPIVTHTNLENCINGTII